MISKKEKEDLLRSYEPILKFHEDEKFLPIPVELYLEYCFLMEKRPFRDKDITENWKGARSSDEATGEDPEEIVENLRKYDNDYYLQFVASKYLSTKSIYFVIIVIALFVAVWLTTGWSFHIFLSTLFVIIGLLVTQTTLKVNRFLLTMNLIYILGIGSYRIFDLGLLQPFFRQSWIIPVTSVCIIFLSLGFLGQYRFVIRESDDPTPVSKLEAANIKYNSVFIVGTTIGVILYSLYVESSYILLLYFSILFIVPELSSFPGFLMSLLSGISPDTVIRAYKQYSIIRQKLGRGNKRLYHYYGRVIEAGNFLVLQYFYFYAFNDWRTAANGLNQHEADWEMATIYLPEKKYSQEGDRPEPAEVVLSAHIGGSALAWDSVEYKEELHPVIFVAKGSHANYFFPKEYPILEDILKGKKWMRFLLNPWKEARLGGRQFIGRVSQNSGRLSQLLRMPEAVGGSQSVYNNDISNQTVLTDLALGNGVVLGENQGQEKRKLNLQLLDDEDPGGMPGWVDFKGFWGRDSIPGEEGPSGPKWDGKDAQRLRWEKPVDWLYKIKGQQSAVYIENV